MIAIDSDELSRVTGSAKLPIGVKALKWTFALGGGLAIGILPGTVVHTLGALLDTFERAQRKLGAGAE